MLTDLLEKINQTHFQREQSKSMKPTNTAKSQNALERLDVATCTDLFQVHLHQQRYDLTLDHIQPKDEVLEVGTGLGVFSETLSKKSELYRGIEYDEVTCNAAKLRVANPDWISLGDAQAMEAESNSFDVIVCLEVLEHLPDYRKALDEFVRVLRPSGKLIASIPYVEVGAPSKINSHHLYEPGELEFKNELNQRFNDVRFLYQRYSETEYETWARKLRLRRLLGLDKQYARVSQGDPAEMKKVLLDESRAGMLLGLFAVASKPNHR